VEECVKVGMFEGGPPALSLGRLAAALEGCKNVPLLRPAATGLGPLELVPLHSPRPLRYPLWGLRIGCLRTRAIAPAYLGHSLRDGVTFRFRGGIQRALTRICAPQLRDARTRGCLIFAYWRLGLGNVRTTRAGFPAAIE
jgi:hypothetical protein